MSQLLSIGAWYVLPNLVTNWLQTIYYRTTIRAGDPQPQPGSPRFIRHHRNIFILVILSYLAYTIYEADWDLQRHGDFYTDLGLAAGADERRIQSSFRRLTRQYHPDKLVNPTAEQRQLAAGYFVHLTNARDTLVDPAKRFAYERFGPDMLEWKSCITKLDFVTQGVKNMIPYYLISMVTLFGMSLLGYAQFGRYWHYFTIAALMLFETHTITRPVFPPILTKILNPLIQYTSHPQFLPFQAIAIARRVALSVFIAVSQIAPRLRDQQTADEKDEAQQVLARINHAISTLDNTSLNLLNLQTVPFMNDEELEGRLKEQMKAWMVRNEIRNDKGVDAAVRAALERKMRGEAESMEESIDALGS